jgi:hypothetical protein
MAGFELLHIGIEIHPRCDVRRPAAAIDSDSVTG